MEQARQARHGPIRLLVLTTIGYYPVEEVAEMHEAGRAAKVWIMDLPMEMEFLDQRFLANNVPVWRRMFYRLLPIWLAQAVEAFIIKGRYDVVFSWGAEPVSLSFSLLQKIARTRVPCVGLFGWVSPRKKARFLRLVHSQYTKLIIPPSLQREYAIEKIGVPAEKIVAVPWCVDEDFWQPREGVTPEPMICSAGREMRDYITLINALEDTGIRCDIAGSLIPGQKDAWIKEVDGYGDLPRNISFRSRSAVELRDMYARSRFLVIPVLPSDTDNGVSCMLEAMSMGKAVICSKVDGQRDVLEPGVTGIFVRPGDADELRRAIMDLWEHPEEAARMGREGRRRVEERYPLDRYIREVGAVIEEAAIGSAERVKT